MSDNADQPLNLRTDISTPNPAPQEVIEPVFEVASFWQRLFAYIIDLVLLSIPFLIFGFIFKDFSYSLGPFGRPIGYIALLIYWTYFHSEHGKGQTLGKAFMKIVVIDKNKNYLSVKQAFLRGLVLAVISLFNGWSLQILEEPIIAILVSTIVFGGTLSVMYGLIFNRKTRQSLHDLLAGSYVIKAPPIHESITPVIRPIHKRITYGLVLISLFFGALGNFATHQGLISPTFGILSETEYESLQDFYELLSEELRGEYFSLQVKHQNTRTTINSSSTTMETIDITIWLKTPCNFSEMQCQDLVNKIAKLTIDHYDNISEFDGIRIFITNRFDLGLASGHFTLNIADSIENWKNLLSADSAE